MLLRRSPIDEFVRGSTADQATLKIMRAARWNPKGDVLHDTADLSPELVDAAVDLSIRLREVDRLPDQIYRDSETNKPTAAAPVLTELGINLNRQHTKP